MPFTFKLSQRLARIYDRSVSGSALCRPLCAHVSHLPTTKAVRSSPTKSIQKAGLR